MLYSRVKIRNCKRLVSTIDTSGRRLVQNSDLMIRLPILKDELAFLEKLLPDLETRPDLGHLASEFKKRIDKIRQEIRAIQEKG
jgi:hypothetical protein